MGSASPFLLGRTTLLVVLLVVVVVGLEDALSELLLSFMDVLVELVAVFADRELLVVVDGDVDSACANRLIFRVVELCHVRMAQSLLSSHASMRVELEEALEHVERVIRGRWEHVSQPARLSGRQ